MTTSARQHPTLRFRASCAWCRALVAGSVAAAVLLSVAPAQATDISKLKAQKNALSAQLEKAGSAYRRALYRTENNEDDIATLQRRSKKTAAELARSQLNLQARARTIYRMNGMDFVSVILGAVDYEDLFTRMDFIRSIVDRNAREIKAEKALRVRYAAEIATLRRERSALLSNQRLLKERRDEVGALMKAKQKEYEAAKRALGAAAANARGGFAPAGPSGMVFPVDGPCYFDDTWGAPRSGGRSHKGTDIMAAQGTPCVATYSGTVSSKEGGLGGKVIYLDADNGWRFYYAHLSGWAVRSGHVRAGQLIGYVGATGNAAGGAPHCHLQMWTPGGAIVNPYSYLRAAQ